MQRFWWCPVGQDKNWCCNIPINPHPASSSMGNSVAFLLSFIATSASSFVSGFEGLSVPVTNEHNLIPLFPNNHIYIPCKAPAVWAGSKNSCVVLTCLIGDKKMQLDHLVCSAVTSQWWETVRHLQMLQDNGLSIYPVHFYSSLSVKHAAERERSYI